MGCGEWWSDESGGVKWNEMVNIGGVRWKKRDEGRYWRGEVEVEG